LAVFGAQEAYIRLTPNDPLFVVTRSRRHPAPHSGEVCLATSREAAFGYCLAHFRPRHGLSDRMDAFLLPAGIEDDYDLLSGVLDGRFFDRRVLLELRPAEDIAFEPEGRARRRFAPTARSRFTRRAVAGVRRIGVHAVSPRVGREARRLHWTYFVVWDGRTAEATLELEGSSDIELDDPDLLRAAARLGITLT
jgi:hypothetical protein